MYEGCTLGIEVGTHKSKGVIVTKVGYAEHNAFSWWNNFVFLTKDLLQKTGIDSSSISAVGYSSIAPTCL